MYIFYLFMANLTTLLVTQEMMHSVTQYTDTTNRFFGLKTAYGFNVHA
jgi:hypothetical protein